MPPVKSSTTPGPAGAPAREPPRAPGAASTVAAPGGDLPIDVAARVVDHLELEDTVAAAQASSLWHEAVARSRPRLPGDALALFLRSQRAGRGSVAAVLDALAAHPESRARLARIRHLSCPNMGLDVLDVAAIARWCPGLEALDLQDNALAALPDEIFELRHLTQLNLRLNALTHLPEAIGKLGHLECLNLVGNRLAELPHSLAALRHLRVLALGHNALTTWPESLRGLAPSCEVHVRGNLLPDDPSA